MSGRIILACILVLQALPALAANPTSVTVIYPFAGYSKGQVITDQPTIDAIEAGINSAYVTPTMGSSTATPPAPSVTVTYNGVPLKMNLGPGLSTDGTNLNLSPQAATAAANTPCAALAAAGTTLGAATPLTCPYNVIASGALDTGVLVDPVLCQSGQVVLNATTTEKKVYVASSAQLSANGVAMGTGNPGLLEPGVTSTLRCPTATNYVAN